MSAALLCLVSCKAKSNEQRSKQIDMTFECTKSDKQCVDMKAYIKSMDRGLQVFTVAAIELAPDSRATIADIDAYCRTHEWVRRLPRGSSGSVVVLQTPYDVSESESRETLGAVLCPQDWVTFYYYEDYQIRFSSFFGTRKCIAPTDAGVEP